MVEKVIINYSVLEQTRDKIMALAAKTFRSQGNVVDLAIDELYGRVVDGDRIKLTPAGEEALRQVEAEGKPE